MLTSRLQLIFIIDESADTFFVNRLIGLIWSIKCQKMFPIAQNDVLKMLDKYIEFTKI